ncbi:hypothetical protein BDF14DRAFT_34518 [Spinellus fusiger]|nr:hypothetical protein BDF14DRAFT_34518 [Spinellus fusiger]
MIPLLTKRDTAPRSGHTQLTSPVHTHPTSFDYAKHRRNSSYSIQLPSSDIINLEVGQATRKGKSAWAVKDKVLEPHQFFLLSSYQKSKHYLRHGYWLRWTALAACFFFVLFYLHSLLTSITTNTGTLLGSGTVVRDQLILYRILGNDLPPRHKEGQTLSNLRFILQHEPAFPNTRKLFVLNRISDPLNEATIIQLLNEYGMEYIVLPFEQTIYKNIDFRLEDFPEPDYLHSDDYRRFSKVKKLRALDYTYHDKNLYAMNNNGGRNAAIRHAQAIENAQWVMPFDGNCFLSQRGYSEIHTQLEKYGSDTKYFVVPMTRLLNNSVLLQNTDERPKAPEEPQIIFRYDATEEYNLNMRYGRRSKLELLWRLGALENRRLNRPTVPWESIERPYSKDKGNFRTIGWVFRLFSGNPQQEESKKEASSIRGFNRLLAIQSSLDSLDESIARRTFRQEQLFVFDSQEMAKIRYDYWANKPQVVAMVDYLAEEAHTVINSTLQHMAFVTAMTDKNEGQSSRKELGLALECVGALTYNVTTLTLASYYLGNGDYGRHAANLIRVYLLNEYAIENEDMHMSAREKVDTSHLLDFLSDQGYSFPSLNHIPQEFPHYTTDNRKTLELAKVDISSLLDSIRILRRMQLLTHKEYINLQAIAAQVLEYRVTSPTGIHLAQMADHRGVLYDLQVISLSAFANDVRLFLRVANRCRMRIGKQFTAQGEQSHQIATAKARLQSSLPLSLIHTDEGYSLLHYESLNLQYWTLLARGIQNSGVANDIWQYTAKEQQSLSHTVIVHLQKYAAALKDMPPEKVAFAQSRLCPLAYMANAAFSHRPLLAGASKEEADWLGQHLSEFGSKYTGPNAIATVMPVGSSQEDTSKDRMGVPPFWMLATQT